MTPAASVPALVSFVAGCVDVAEAASRACFSSFSSCVMRASASASFACAFLASSRALWRSRRALVGSALAAS